MMSNNSINVGERAKGAMMVHAIVRRNEGGTYYYKLSVADTVFCEGWCDTPEWALDKVAVGLLECKDEVANALEYGD